MDTEKLAKALRDTAQSASNAVAGNVSAPVDLLAAALRKTGLNIPDNAVGGSVWMQQNGLTTPVEDGMPKYIGEAVGGVLPMFMMKVPK
jgi:hypothetical protein